MSVHERYPGYAVRTVDVTSLPGYDLRLLEQSQGNDRFWELVAHRDDAGDLWRQKYHDRQWAGIVFAQRAGRPVRHG